MDAQGILPAIVIRTEPSPSLGPRRGGAPGRMGRAHGLPSSTVVRGTKTPPAKRTTVLPAGQADRAAQLPASLDRPIALPYNAGMPKHSVAPNGASNGAVPAAAKVSRKQAAANADGLLRAEGLQMSPEHQALSARWVAGEFDGAELERLGLELVRQRLATASVR
jgi:hypothetical protein